MNTGTTSDYTKTQVPSNLSQDLGIESSSHPALIFSAAVALASGGHLCWVAAIASALKTDDQ